jgi:uncharacterized protein (DUF305 family)
VDAATVIEARFIRRDGVCLVFGLMRGSHLAAFTAVLACWCSGACATTGETVGSATGAPIVQPGAPGEPSRVITAEQATSLPRVQHTAVDVRFMQGMMAHHRQALEMTALRPERSTSEDLRLMALRIELSQADEITMMQEWLKARGEQVPDAHAHHAEHATLMPGMLTAADMSRLSGARGAEFDRQFLELMIKHHEGALIMVEQLFAIPAAGQESEVFAFASDVVDDQRIEIARMAAMLKERQQ